MAKSSAKIKAGTRVKADAKNNTKTDAGNGVKNNAICRRSG